MGSFNVSCSLTDVIIAKDDPFVAFLAINEQLPPAHPMQKNAYTYWQPATLPWKGKGRDYGWNLIHENGDDKKWAKRVLHVFYNVCNMLKLPCETVQLNACADLALKSETVEMLRKRNPHLYEKVETAHKLYPQSEQELEEWEALCNAQYDSLNSSENFAIPHRFEDEWAMYLPWCHQLATVANIFISQKTIDVLEKRAVILSEDGPAENTAEWGVKVLEALAMFPSVLNSKGYSGQDYAKRGDTSLGMLMEQHLEAPSFNRITIQMDITDSPIEVDKLESLGMFNCISFIDERSQFIVGWLSTGDERVLDYLENTYPTAKSVVEIFRSHKAKTISQPDTY